jgi:signal transduction histidine kinase
VKILIIEDDPKRADALREGFRVEGYEARVARTDDPGALRDTISSMLEETQRLRVLTDSVLLLTRVESDPTRRPRTLVGLEEVMGDVRNSLNVLAAEKKQTIDLQGEPGLAASSMEQSSSKARWERGASFASSCRLQARTLRNLKEIFIGKASSSKPHLLLDRLRWTWSADGRFEVMGNQNRNGRDTI